jgi:hypothetical protein
MDLWVLPGGAPSPDVAPHYVVQWPPQSPAARARSPSFAQRACTQSLSRRARFDFRSFDGVTTTNGQQKLSYISNTALSCNPRELHATHSLLEADLNGNAIGEFAIYLRNKILITSRNLVL